MIRDATLDDIPALLALGARMHAESPHFLQIAFSAEKLEATLRNVLAAEGGFLVVADVGGQVAGVMMGLAMQHWCSDDIVATELALYVEPECRGSLLAARLIRRYLSWAGALGAKIITAGVSTGVNVEQTARLYEAMGMKRFGVLLEA